MKIKTPWTVLVAGILLHFSMIQNVSAIGMKYSSSWYRIEWSGAVFTRNNSWIVVSMSKSISSNHQAGMLWSLGVVDGLGMQDGCRDVRWTGDLSDIFWPSLEGGCMRSHGYFRQPAWRACQPMAAMPHASCPAQSFQWTRSFDSSHSPHSLPISNDSPYANRPEARFYHRQW